MASLPPHEVISACKPIGLGMIYFWLVQPFVFRYCLVEDTNNVKPKPLWLRITATLRYGVTMYWLADALREALGVYYSSNVNIIWWIYALISVKYLHATLSPTFGSDLGGLTSW